MDNNIVECIFWVCAIVSNIALFVIILIKCYNDFSTSAVVGFIFNNKVSRMVMEYKWRQTALNGMAIDTCSSTGEEEGGGCSICLEKYEDGERRATIVACDHRFHAVCIEAWMDHSYTCPLCRDCLV